MSYVHIEMVKDAALVPSRKAVLLWQAYRANDDGEAWPGPASIARATGFNLRTVKRALRDLRDAGWLVDTGRKGPGGTIRYVLARGTVTPGQPDTGAPSPGDSASTDRGHRATAASGMESRTSGTTPPKEQEEQETPHQGADGVGQGETSPPLAREKGNQAPADLNLWAPDTWEEAKRVHPRARELLSIVPKGLLAGEHWCKWQRLLLEYGWSNVIKGAALTDAGRRYASEVEKVLQERLNAKAKQ